MDRQPAKIYRKFYLYDITALVVDVETQQTHEYTITVPYTATPNENKMKKQVGNHLTKGSERVVAIMNYSKRVVRAEMQLQEFMANAKITQM